MNIYLKANTNNQNVNLHHWLCYRYDEQYFENKCQACSRVKALYTFYTFQNFYLTNIKYIYI